MYYVSQYSERDYLFGPDGVLPFDEFKQQLSSINLYSLSASPAWFQLVYHAGALAALAVMLGVGGRFGLGLHWLLLWSVYQRQPVLLDGGDNLAYVVIPFLLLTRCYERFAFPSGFMRRFSRRVPSSVRDLSVPFHNLGILMISAQVCLVYVVSGLYKVMGQMWQDGTALFYVMRVPEFQLPGWSNLIYENDWLIHLGTYGTVIFLVYFPLGILVPKLRPWAAAISVGFHLSIAFFMGLTSFALTMIACDLIFLSSTLGRTLSWSEDLLLRASLRGRGSRQSKGFQAAQDAGVPHEEEFIR
ncbi:HTTM domain-containing protein [Streptomyces pathocidini]|uniref:HTTM domain-containing protein n=1 Tax=Streptomyces pathocidini TaxID=1650571 RepID=A0ABW7UNQ1_9ACTN|nr:HTTM domain-containing protein [Streptomyces pathocidini]